MCKRNRVTRFNEGREGGTGPRLRACVQLGKMFFLGGRPSKPEGTHVEYE